MRLALAFLALAFLLAPAALAGPVTLDLPAPEAHTHASCDVFTYPDPRAGVPCAEQTLLCLVDQALNLACPF